MVLANNMFFLYSFLLFIAAVFTYYYADCQIVHDPSQEWAIVRDIATMIIALFALMVSAVLVLLLLALIARG